ncbi:MAG: tetratricopeptide repeat protein [Planctomycetota bacterium]
MKSDETLRQGPASTEPAPPTRAAVGALPLALLLVALVVGVFWPVLRGGFVYDDELLFGPKNEATSSVGAALRLALDPLWSFDRPAHAGAAGESLDRAFWRPLTVLAFALGRALPGPEAFGPHLMSLLVHLCAVLAAWRLATRLLRDSLAGFCVAALFAVHPLMAEPVAWAAAINDPLAGGLILGALLAHARWRDRARGGAPLLGGALALLALLAKEQALVLPLLVVGLDLALGLRPSARALAPYVVALGLWYVARAWIFGHFLAGLFARQGDFGFADLAREVTFRIELIGGALALLVWPRDLTVFRPVHPVLPEGDPAVLIGGAALAVFAVMVGVALWRRARVTAFGLGLTAVMPALVAAALHTAGRYPLSDRYLYLSVFGAALALIAAVRRLAPTRATALIALVLVAASIMPTRAHVGAFKDSDAFHARAVALAPKDAYVQVNAGRQELKAYQDTLDIEHLFQAYRHFLLSLTSGTNHGKFQVDDDPSLPLKQRIERLERMLHAPAEERRPDPTVFWTPYDRLEANLGQLYVHLFASDGSPLDDFAASLEIADELVKVFGKEARVWTAKGQVHRKRAEDDQAEAAFRKALELDRSDALAWKQLALTLTDLGRDGEAREAYEEGARIVPGDLSLVTGAAAAALRAGEFAVAESLVQQIEERVPGSREAAFWRGRAALAQGRLEEALAAFDVALSIDPGWGDAMKHKGLALLRMNDATAALETLGNAARVMPDDFEVHYQIAALMSAMKSLEDEDASWRGQRLGMLMRAYELAPASELRINLQNALTPFVSGAPDRAFSLATLSEKRKDLYSARYWLEHTVRESEAWPELERSQNLGLALTRLGSVMRQRGDVAEAVDALMAAVEYVPENFDTLFECATSLYSVGRKAEAGAMAQRALLELPKARVVEDMRGAVEQILQGWVKEANALNAVGPAPPPNKDE